MNLSRNVALLLLIVAEAHAEPCTGTVKFQAPVHYSTAAGRVVLVRDLNGDGAPDILTSGNQVDQMDAFSMLANRGDGSLEREQLLPSAFGEKLEDAGDIDGDGVPDLLVSNYWSNGIATYHGKGSFAFDAGVARGTATHGGPSLIADYDLDSIPDVVSFSFGSGNLVRVHLFRGQADGTLAAKKTIDTNLSNADSPSLRVMNGVAEILVSDHSGHLGIVRFDRGTVSVTTLPVMGVDQASTFVDLNGDGIADIVAISNDVTGSRELISTALGKSDGTFGDFRQLDRPRHLDFAVAVHSGDLDGDGRADLIVRDFGSTNVYYYRGDGTGGFAEGVAVDAGGVVNDIAIADVNRDGHPDIVTVNGDHAVAVIINNGPCQPARRRSVTR